MRRRARTRRPPATALLGSAIILAAGCGGGPPEQMGGFELGLTQEEVLERARERGGFGCRIRSSRPPRTVCEGLGEGGTVIVTVAGDSVVEVALRLDGRPMAPSGAPAWRDRPVPPRVLPPEGYHTLWVDRDSTRALALVCAGERLAPPCVATLRPATPAGIQAQLDTLLGIRR